MTDSIDFLSPDEAERRMPALAMIGDAQIHRETRELTAAAPHYFWEVPASTSGYHHPACRRGRGLWIHTLMVVTVLDRLSESYVQQGLIDHRERDLAIAAGVLHDQRKNGDPASPSPKSVSDHDLRMSRVVREESDLDEQVADVIASHMGPWYDGPQPEEPIEQLVHNADMVASTESISPAVPGPLPDELAGRDLEVI